MFGEPRGAAGVSMRSIDIALCNVPISLILVESLPCLSISAGLITTTTAAAKAAKIEITIRSSTRVKPLFLFVRGL